MEEFCINGSGEGSAMCILLSMLPLSLFEDLYILQRPLLRLFFCFAIDNVESMTFSFGIVKD